MITARRQNLLGLALIQAAVLVAIACPAVAFAAPFTNITDVGVTPGCPPVLTVDADTDAILLRGCSSGTPSVLVRRGTGPYAPITPPYPAGTQSTPLAVAFDGAGAGHLLACERTSTSPTPSTRLVEYVLGATATTWATGTTLLSPLPGELSSCQYPGTLRFDGVTRLLSVTYFKQDPATGGFPSYVRVYEGAGSTFEQAADFRGSGVLGVGPDGSAVLASSDGTTVSYQVRPHGGSFGPRQTLEQPLPATSELTGLVTGRGGRALLAVGTPERTTVFLRPAAGSAFGTPQEYPGYPGTGATSADGTMQLPLDREYDQAHTVNVLSVTPTGGLPGDAVQIARSNGQPFPLTISPYGASGAAVVFRDRGSFDGTAPQRLRVVRRPPGTAVYGAPETESDESLTQLSALSVAAGQTASSSSLLRLAGLRPSTSPETTNRLLTAELDLSAPIGVAPTEETTPPVDTTGPALQAPSGATAPVAGTETSLAVEAYDSSGIGAATVTVDGAAVSVERTEFPTAARLAFKVTFRTPGTHTVAVTAADKSPAANTTTASFPIEVAQGAAASPPPPPPPPPPVPVAPPKPPTPPRDTAKPVLLVLRLTPRSVAFQSSEAGTATVVITRTLKGRRKGATCATGRAAPKRGRVCTVKKHRSASARVVAGAAKIRLPSLAPGTYRIAVRVEDAAGNLSPALSGTLRIRPRRS